VNESLLDTIDIKDEREDVDEVDEIVAAAVDTPSEPVERSAPRLAELILMSAANGIWAVVGLVIWLPQATRAVLGATLRTVHAALTGQSSGRAVSSIRQVSRSYVERFFRRREEPVPFGRRQELRPLRLAGETLWTAAFYLLALRWLAPQLFASFWERLRNAAAATGSRGAAAGGGPKSGLLPDLASFDATHLQAGGILLALGVVGLVLGFWLGRRGR
jgi:hypothetical protein